MRLPVRLLASLLLILIACGPALAGWSQDVAQANQAARQGRLDQAIPLYERALKDPAMSRANQAVVNYNLGNCCAKQAPSLPVAQQSACEKKALAAYTRAVALDPGLAKAWNNRGNVYRLRGSLTAALNDYTRAIQADPKFAPAWRNRSIAYEKSDRLAEALSDAQAYLRLMPGDQRETSRLTRLKQKLAEQQSKAPRALELAQAGQAAMHKRQYKQALEYIHQALVLNALSPYAAARTYANQGTCWYHLGHYKKAAQSYGRAVDQDPSFAGAYRDRGIAYLRIKDFRAAAANFSAALNRDPKLASAYYHRGLAFWSLGDFSRAQADLKRYLQMQPNDAQAQGILKQVQSGQKANYR